MDKLKEDSDNFADKVLRNFAEAEQIVLTKEIQVQTRLLKQIPLIFCQIISHRLDVILYYHQSRKTQ